MREPKQLLLVDREVEGLLFFPPSAVAEVVRAFASMADEHERLSRVRLGLRGVVYAGFHLVRRSVPQGQPSWLAHAVVCWLLLLGEKEK